MKVIARIRTGQRITYDNNSYDVIGTRKLRSVYFYIVRDVNGRTFSMRRDYVLMGQHSGELRVSA